jgi:hypothetical protein
VKANHYISICQNSILTFILLPYTSSFAPTHRPTFGLEFVLGLWGFSDLESRGCHLRPQMALFAFSSLPKRHGLETGGVLSLFQKGG